MFTTKGRDNDKNPRNCAMMYGAPWWFQSCHNAFLTGKHGKVVSHAKGITWNTAWGNDKYARYAVLMIRPNV